MKNFFLIIMALAIAFSNYGQLAGTITTNQSELTFSTKDNYDLIELSNHRFTTNIGAPQLPIKTFKYVLPVEAEVTGIEIVNFMREQVSGSYLIYPVQPVAIPDGSPPPAFVPPSGDIYNSSAPYPGQIAELTDDSYIMGYKIVSITIYPIEYIPADREVYLYTSIDFVIDYTLGTSPVQFPDCMSSFRKQAVKEKIKMLVDNDSDIESCSSQFNNIPEDASLLNLPIQEQYPWSLGVIPDYLIITTQALKQVFIDEFIKEKNKLGMPAVIATLEEDIIGKYNGCDSAEQIRKFILAITQNGGYNWYILLGGDVNLIPARLSEISTEIAPTDLYYSAVSGPWNYNGNEKFGEINDGPAGGRVLDNPQNIIGRLPVRSVNDVIDYAKKLEEYETLQYYEGNQYHNIPDEFIKNFLAIIGTSAVSNNFWAVGMEPYLIDPYVPQDINRRKLYSTDVSGSGIYEELTRGSAINNLNKISPIGFNIVFHFDHSGPYTMGAGDIEYSDVIFKSDVKDLHNSHTHHIYVSVGCRNNNFSFASISKEFLKNTSGGGISFIGSSISLGYTYQYTFGNFCNHVFNLNYS
ncbi:MAG: C25 family cysteine peptidase [bacterium]